MKNSELVSSMLSKQGKYPFLEGNDGLLIETDGNEVLIKGSADDLIELADLLVSVALSDVYGDHVHIDDFTLVDRESKIGELIIEKRSK